MKSVSVDELPEAEIVIVLGGDGTILRGAEISRLRKIPLLGVNLGHVGFMAEVEKLSLEAVAASVIVKELHDRSSNGSWRTQLSEMERRSRRAGRSMK